MNDQDSAKTNGLYGSDPMGVEMQVTVWAYNQPDFKPGQAIYKKYKIKNISSDIFEEMYLSQWSDPDLGNFSDDLVGCDSVNSTVFANNSNENDIFFSEFGLAPPAVGYTLLQGPIVPSPGDTAFFDSQRLFDYKNLPMTSFGDFTFWVVWGDPVIGDYDGTLQWYNMLRGNIPTTNIDNPTPFIHRNTGAITKFPLNGDPVTATGDVDGIYVSAGDRRMALISGPFTLNPGETQEMVVALVGGHGDTHLTSITEMKSNMDFIRQTYGKPLIVPTISKELIHPDNASSTLFLKAAFSDHEPIESCTMIFNSQFGNDPSFTVTLFDDGLHDDGSAADNVWGNIWTGPNRKYPHNGDLIFSLDSTPVQYSNYIEDIRLRPLPHLDNFQVTWENAKQDGKLNINEDIHLQFDISNDDLRNAIDSMKIESHRTFIFNDGFGKGQTIRNDSLFFVLTGPSSGDSLTFSYRVNFDHHSGIIFETIPIAPSKSNKAWRDTIEVVSIRGRTDHVVLLAADPPQFTGHNYLITFNEDPKTNKLLWSLKDDLTGELKIDKSELSNDPYFAYPVVDGILYKMTDIKEEFKNFQVISNANGLVVPPEGGAANFQSFPSARPTDNQQVGSGRWLFHAGETDGSYESFLTSAMRGSNFSRAIPYDWEMRFTSRGSWSVRAYEDSQLVKVPFELWNIGIDTPDDPRDDYRLIPWFRSNGSAGGLQTDTTGRTYQLDPNDHPVSGGANDPYTPWIYWRIPQEHLDGSPGETGYNAYLSKIDTITANDGEVNGYQYDGAEVMAHTVLVSWNGDDVSDGVVNAGVQMSPEQGTIFRITTPKPNFDGDSLLVHSPQAVPDSGPIPAIFFLRQNYPNPFNPITHIQFGLSKKTKVKLEVFNMLGQKVKTLINTNLHAGTFDIEWNGKNDAGNLVSSGLYIYKLEVGNSSQSMKMIFLK